MDVILIPFFNVLFVILDLYIWALVISVIMSWLVQFNVINTRNRFVYTVGDILYRITEPALRPIRRILPNMGGIDLSPMVLILGIWFIEGVLRRLAMKMAM